MRSRALMVVFLVIVLKLARPAKPSRRYQSQRFARGQSVTLHIARYHHHHLLPSSSQQPGHRCAVCPRERHNVLHQTVPRRQPRIHRLRRHLRSDPHRRASSYPVRSSNTPYSPAPTVIEQSVMSARQQQQIRRSSAESAAENEEGQSSGQSKCECIVRGADEQE